MSTGDWMSILFGFPLIVIGILVVRFPMMISGYNTMSKARREKVDVDGLSRMMRRYLILMGVGLAVAPIVLRKMNFTSVAAFFPLVFIFALSLIMKIKSRRYMKAADVSTDAVPQKALSSRERVLRKFFKVFLAIVIGLLLIQFVYVLIPSKVEVTDQAIVITGAYGRTIPKDQIQEIKIQDHLQLTLRTNGVAVGDFFQGHFRSKQLGSCLLFLRNGKTPPYIILTLKDEKPVVLNCKTSEQTRELYDKLLKISVK